MSGEVDLGLSIPLRGVQLIEASAGTGKTFALATLYARLVIESGLAVPNILAVTYTEAAAKELRDRLRKRLVLARELAVGKPADDGSEQERLTATLVRAAIAREGRPALLHRLHVACRAMDLAPICTIHVFCRRALSDHALEAGQPLLDRATIENEQSLRLEVATDFWRSASHDALQARTLRELWPSPKRLADSLGDLLALETLLPASAEVGAGAEHALQSARRELASAFINFGDDARDSLQRALANKVLRANVYKPDHVESVWLELADWVLQPEARDPKQEKLPNYARTRLEANTNNDKTTPSSPLFVAIDAWVVAKNAADAERQLHRIALIHQARDYARHRLALLKRERGLIGFDDMIGGVAEALAGPAGDDFAARLQAQYAVALLDEFQDTDPRQWAIFHRLFAQPAGSSPETVAPDAGPTTTRALFLIGDPKQAIYRFRGGDVFTYLEAAGRADARHALARNFRSRPAMLRAVQALFELSGDDAFAQDGIRFHPVAASDGRSDDDFRRDQVSAPALTVLVLPDGERSDVESVRDLATQACVHEIHRLLADGLAGRAQLIDRRGITRAVAPGDIAVLVEKNSDAQSMKDALSQAGIPCVAGGRQSLYATEEAEQLRWLLEALLAPADDERLRAALATPLFALDAAAIAALDDDDSAHRYWQDRLQSWRQQGERHGVLALLGDLCADGAPRLLALVDGERRLSNLLQLGEALQTEPGSALGLRGTLDALERRVVDADRNNEAELLRLESDAARVQILTLHKSKGLEFELVFLPYAATNGKARPSGIPPMARYHDGARRVGLLFPDKDGDGERADKREERAERLRLLYVGLTRARLATWLAWGKTNNVQHTPLAWLLHRAAGDPVPGTIDRQSIDARLALLKAQAPDAIAVVAADPVLPDTRLGFADDQPSPSAAVVQRSLSRDWWVHSFSQLTREDDGREQGGAGDEIEPVLAIAPSRFSGARFGNSLHAALERVRFEAWRDCRDDAPPEGEFDALAGALRGEAYVSQADLLEGVPLLARLIRNTLTVRLPEGGCLAELPVAMRRSELEFHFSLRATPLDALLALLRGHGLLRGRDRFGQRARIEGLMTGKIDLVYERAGRFYLLDYKSNQLSDYGADALDAAMHDHEYTLQYLIYTLALHRWLRFRLGAGYDYDRHFGGVRYLFCRGLDAARDDSPGVHAVRPARALIESLDALLAPVAAAVAP
jgi:exodeoxyribonuclease V beta subunit